MRVVPGKSFASALLAGASLLTIGGHAAMAGAFGLHEQSAEALGESFAGVAAGAGGLSAMFWNPATLTENAGWQSSQSYSLLIPYAAPQFVSSNNPALGLLPTNQNQFVAPVLLPAGYSSYQFNDKLWLGLAINTPFGLSTKNPVGSAESLWGLTTTVFTTDVNPQIAYKINDWISIGAGFQAVYMETRQTVGANLPPAAPVIAQLKGNSWGFGFNLGVTLKPMDGTEIGVGYRSFVREGLKGNLSGLSPLANPVSAPLTLPDTLTVGVRQRVSPQLTLLAGVEWTNWSREQALTITSLGGQLAPAGVVVRTIPLNYRDGWMFSLGGEYQINPAWTARAGLAYEQSPITDTNRNVTLLDSDRVWASIGASFKVNEKLKLDASYAHVSYQSGKITMPATLTNPLTYNGTSSASGDVVSVGFTYRFDTPAPAVVAKY
jgi:long-chain fatty acid transport protein